jgi:DNA adenine methylase
MTAGSAQLRRAPLLKWPGGKRALIRDLLPLVPSCFRRYYEPFAGGAALFFALRPHEALLADSNQELINCYAQVRDRPERVLRYLRTMPNTEEDYYRIRDSFPRSRAHQAARLIYLATLSFNGIYRVNLKGLFNVPYGRKAHLNPYDAPRLRSAAESLSAVELLCCDFENAVETAGARDFVYLDPPYTVAHGDNGFLKYNSRIFSWTDQVRLARVASRLAARGCAVVVSNADHPSIAALYGAFRVIRVSRFSRIAASADSRGRITECIFYTEGTRGC